ncbi:hypothetical protein V6N13_042163 [Hibiscus sabdariffa]|uniref:Uncharacterized protein n=1 Tax=Hibiscus sabdariffa TaxID=183260 RepID=A0ABR2DFX2_9ROSI
MELRIEHSAQNWGSKTETKPSLYSSGKAEIGSLGAAKTINEKWNKFVNGSGGSEEEVEEEQSCDYEFHPETWDFSNA